MYKEMLNDAEFKEWTEKFKGRIKIVSLRNINGEFWVMLSHHPEQKKNLVVHRLTVEESKQLANNCLDFNKGEPYQYKDYWKIKGERDRKAAEEKAFRSNPANSIEFDNIDEGNTVFKNGERIGYIVDTIEGVHRRWLVVACDDGENKLMAYDDNVVVL